MTFAFIIPSAINDRANTSIDNTMEPTAPSEHSAESAYEQLLATVRSINESAKGSLISVIEHGAIALDDTKKIDLLKQIDFLMEYNNNEIIQKTIEQYAERIKSFNLTELTCLIWFLEVAQQHQIFSKVKRLFFIRPGQVFDPAVHALSANKPEAKNKFILPNSYPSPYLSGQTGNICLQFNTDIWSFEPGQIPSLLESLKKMRAFMEQRFNEDGYVDLGHCLYKFINASHIFYDLALVTKPNAD
ncbi:hypothetical protein KU392_01195 [Advenella alkanexedens]|uniref:UBC core domain-containing protein n=1 Tax=Advenella alkanexedens TaxID=1481665 RepID=A0ABS6NJQ8_9BURK|nr:MULTISPECIES: hypothetical protein [Advenella]MBV4395868.1 hypothetical protein [Advenella alkanexedens]MDD3757342.1 hypothetical protein [Advenella sp.]